VTGSCEGCLEQPRPKESSKIPSIPAIFIELNLGAYNHGSRGSLDRAMFNANEAAAKPQQA
jgi:hypothetical protein